MNNYVQMMVCITQSVTGDKYIKSTVRAEQGMGLSVWNLRVKESGAMWFWVWGLQVGSPGKRAFSYACIPEFQAWHLHGKRREPASVCCFLIITYLYFPFPINKQI